MTGCCICFVPSVKPIVNVREVQQFSYFHFTGHGYSGPEVQFTPRITQCRNIFVLEINTNRNQNVIPKKMKHFGLKKKSNFREAKLNVKKINKIRNQKGDWMMMVVCHFNRKLIGIKRYCTCSILIKKLLKVCGH